MSSSLLTPLSLLLLRLLNCLLPTQQIEHTEGRGLTLGSRAQQRDKPAGVDVTEGEAGRMHDAHEREGEQEKDDFRYNTEEHNKWRNRKEKEDEVPP